MVRCNMTDEETHEAEKLFDGWIPVEMLERAKGAFERFLFFDTWGRKNYREYFCQNCGRFEMERQKVDIYTNDSFTDHHGDLCKCPMCGEEFTLICLGRMRNMKSLKRWENLAFMEERDGMLTISAGVGCMEYGFQNLNPYPEFYEMARYVVEPGKRMMWRREWDNGEMRLEPKKSFTEPFPKTHYYGARIRRGEVKIIGMEELYKTSMKYCSVEEFARAEWCLDYIEWEREPVRGVIRYLGEYSKHPQLEMLVKLGHTDVIQSLLENGTLGKTVDWKAKTPAGFFRMSKADYKVFRECGGGMKNLEKYRERECGVGFAEYMRICAWMKNESEAFFELCKGKEIPAARAWKYLQEQTAEGNYGMDAVRTWRDYVDMAQRLERNMAFKRNIFPENLRAAHDEAAQMQAAEEMEACENGYKKRFGWLKKTYAYSDGEFSIMIPASGEDIKREGKALEHCVGGYATRHLQRKTTILFLRRAEELYTPYVTIEISDADHHIVQAHGYRNERDGATPPMERHKEFFNGWLDWIRRGSPRTKKGKPIMKKEERKTA